MLLGWHCYQTAAAWLLPCWPMGDKHHWKECPPGFWIAYVGWTMWRLCNPFPIGSCLGRVALALFLL